MTGAAQDDLRARLAHIRHDLRTPINAILGYSEMLLEDTANFPDLAAELQQINDHGRTLHERINTLLHDDALGDRTLDEMAARARQELTAPCQTILDLSTSARARCAIPELGAFAADIDNILDASRRFHLLLDSFETQSTGPGPPQKTAAPQPAPPLQRPVISPPPADGGAVSPGAILIVDDNESNRDLLARGLVRQGHRYGLAANGREALALLAEHDFDLVLLDILMPEMDGFETLARIKADPKRSHIPVIMISALDQIDSVVRCIEMGAEDYLPKPFDPVLLRARVGACLEKKRLRDHELEYLRNVAAVTEAAVAVESGTFDAGSLTEVSQRTDPLGQLARVFQSMAREVKARVERLQMQVQQLKVEIDETRKAKQVAEITETDYFQELQQKVQSLRGRRKDQ